MERLTVLQFSDHMTTRTLTLIAAIGSGVAAGVFFAFSLSLIHI